jgi:hypothetical protein
VVVAVLGEIAQFTGGFDLARDLDPAARRQVVVLGLEPVVRRLREVLGLCHRAARLAAAPSVVAGVGLGVPATTATTGHAGGSS